MTRTKKQLRWKYATQDASRRTPGEDEQVDLPEDSFDWDEYLARTSAVGAPRDLFSHVISDQDAGFEHGMKLEVPNRSVAGTYWVASVVMRCGALLLLRYEGYQDDNTADFWCDSYSSSLHPVGWCSKTGHALRPPPDLKGKSIDWYDYLIKNLTGSRTAANCLFGRKPCLLNRLRPGMHVEVTDEQDPCRYWLASVTALFAGRICLQYVGSCDPTLDLWVYYTSPRLHPPGWGNSHDYRLLPPRNLLQRYSKEDLFAVLKSIDHRPADASVLQACFRDAELPRKHGFNVCMKLEAQHPNDPTAVGVATVSRVFDEYYFLVQIDNLLRWPGDYSDSFVCHVDSPGIFPSGWCQQYGLKLQPPVGFNGNFTWDSYLKYTKCKAASADLFPNKNIAEHEFQLGMKVECVDQENQCNVCVATITQIVGNTLWVSLDGESRSEQILDAKSPDLFPPGWCASCGHELQWPRPNTIEQKNRISRLRTTSERKSRLSYLRKGRQPESSPKKATVASLFDSDHRSSSRDGSRPTPKRAVHYFKGRRRFKRKTTTNADDSTDGLADASMSIVCIQRLAADLNTEENIETAFRLRDPDGIEEQDDRGGSNSTVQPQVIIDERQVSWLRLMGLRSVAGTSSTEEDQPPLPAPVQEVVTVDLEPVTKKKKLTSIVAMLLSSGNQSRKLKLLDHDPKRQQSIAEPTDNSTADVAMETDREQAPSRSVVTRGCFVPQAPLNYARTKSSMRLARQASAAARPQAVVRKVQLVPQASSVSQLPEQQHNGQYEIVENVISTDGSRKIILKFSSSHGSQTAGGAVAIMPRTKANVVNQMEIRKRSLEQSNVSKLRTVRRGTENTTTNCQPPGNKPCRTCVTHRRNNNVKQKRKGGAKLARLCLGLPSCPTKWNKQDVARFVQSANLNKYARTFVEQDIDGRSFLLLTFHELHSLLGISLVHSVRLFNYISQLKEKSTSNVTV